MSETVKQIDAKFWRKVPVQHISRCSAGQKTRMVYCCTLLLIYPGFFTQLGRAHHLGVRDPTRLGDELRWTSKEARSSHRVLSVATMDHCFGASTCKPSKTQQTHDRLVDERLLDNNVVAQSHQHHHHTPGKTTRRHSRHDTL